MSDSAIEQSLVAALTEDARRLWPADFAEIEEMFNRCALSMAVDALRRLELFQNVGDSESLGTLREKTRLFDDAGYVFDKLLTILCAERVLELKEGRYLCLDNEPDVETPAELLVMATRRFPAEGASFQWLARAHDGLVRYIKGQAFSEEIMFPWGSFKLIEEVYNTSTVYGFYSKLAGKAVKRIVESQFDRSVTLVELGAGTGNGTANVLAETDSRFEKYLFTDVSKALVQFGRRRLKKLGYDFFTYRDLDISGGLTEQDMPTGQADIVLAVNVVHATDNIGTALEAARRLLKPGGWFVLSELSPPPDAPYRYMELTFGLLPSYAKYSDIHVRPTAPVIRPAEWAAAMTRAGFGAVETIPGDRLEGVDRGGVVLGRK